MPHQQNTQQNGDNLAQTGAVLGGALGLGFAAKTGALTTCLAYLAAISSKDVVLNSLWLELSCATPLATQFATNLARGITNIRMTAPVVIPIGIGAVLGYGLFSLFTKTAVASESTAPTQESSMDDNQTSIPKSP